MYAKTRISEVLGSDFSVAFELNPPPPPVGVPPEESDKTATAFSWNEPFFEAQFEQFPAQQDMSGETLKNFFQNTPVFGEGQPHKQCLSAFTMDAWHRCTLLSLTLILHRHLQLGTEHVSPRILF